MTLEAPVAQFVADDEFTFAARAPTLFPSTGDPEPAWAARNPARLLAFLYVSPRDCDAVDALYA